MADNQSQKMHQTTQGYVDLANKVKEDADKRREDVDKIIADTENNQQQHDQ